MKKRFWVCGQLRGKWNSKGRCIWDFQGIYSTEKRAVAACRNAKYFIFPATLDKELPDEPIDAAGGYYPKDTVKVVACERKSIG